MALTLRTNGSGAQNLVSAAWWNDYYNLLTGSMNDQPVSLNYQPGSSVSTPTLTITSNGNAPLITCFNGSTQEFAVDAQGNTSIGQNLYLTFGGVTKSYLSIDSFGDLTVLANGQMNFDAGGQNQLTLSNGQVQINAPLYLNNANPTVDFINVNTSFGIKKSGGIRIFEVKSAGDITIGGQHFQAVASGAVVSSNQSFDTFDLAEVFELDQPYPDGTIVCPGANGLLTRCSHDACYAAMIISKQPALCAGSYDEHPNVKPIALTGRVRCRTAHDVAYRALVCSDGRGAVRPMVKGDAALALGFALEAAKDGMVGIFIRPMFVRL